MKPEETLNEQTRCDRSVTHHFVADSRPSCSERIDSLARQLTEAERENKWLRERGTGLQIRDRNLELAERYREALERITADDSFYAKRTARQALNTGDGQPQK